MSVAFVSRCCIISFVMLSGPGDLCAGREVMVWLSSVCVNGEHMSVRPSPQAWQW